MKLDLNPEFKQALSLMEDTDRNLFITGKAGTGKSTLLDYFCDKTSKEPVVLAPTGVAALNVQGQTIHRFFNFNIDITPDKIRKKDVRPRNPKLYKQISTIVIDEVSMLRADLLDCVDAFLRLYGPKPGTPFGGVQMIFVGDLYQLPPVVGREERKVFAEIYETPYFFSANAMKKAKVEVVELETVYRQKDAQFIELLNKIRNNSVEPEDIDELNLRYTPDDDSAIAIDAEGNAGAKAKAKSKAKAKAKSKAKAKAKADTKSKTKKSTEVEASAQADAQHAFTISLTTTNAMADELNDKHLNALAGEMLKSEALVIGDFGKEYYPTATDLQFKIGSQIMLLNNDSRNRWVNGSIGVIKDIKQDKDGDDYLRVRLSESGKLVSVEPFTWEVFQFAVEEGTIISKPVGSFTQFPIRLAWAVTIHKSQGKTFDRVVIDLGRGTFASGQAYVALSRCTSFEGMRLRKPIKKGHIRTDWRIFKFLTEHAYQKAAESLSMDDRMTMIKRAIKNDGKLEMTYLKPNDTKSKRVIIPQKVGKESFKGKSFTGLTAYCLSRQDDRIFRVDRILEMKEV